MALGDKHRETLTSVDKLTVLLQDQGKLGEAEPLMRKAMNARREVLGDRHRDTLTSINNLTMLLQDQGKVRAPCSRIAALPLARTWAEALLGQFGDG